MTAMRTDPPPADDDEERQRQIARRLLETVESHAALNDWIDRQEPDTSLDNGVRLFLWKFSRTYEGHNEPVARWLADLSRGIESDLAPLDLKATEEMHVALYACAVAMNVSDPAHYEVTLPERNLAIAVVADDLARLRLRLATLRDMAATGGRMQ